jgi:hypothetical protein
MCQIIEGYNIADLAWGTADAKSVTLSFWVRSSVTGTFGGALRNAGGGGYWGYPFTYNINSANTWEYKTITIPGPTNVSYTWDSTNAQGIYIWWDLGTGSTYTAPAGTWVNKNTVGADGTTKLVTTNAATWYMTGAQLEKGSAASAFEQLQYGHILALCQRYCMAWRQVSSQTYLATGQAYGATLALFTLPFPVTPRIPPTSITVSSAADFGALSYNGGGTTGSSIVINSASVAALGVNYTATTSSFTAGYATTLYTQPGASNAYIYTNGSEL